MSTALTLFSVYKTTFWTGRRFVFENVQSDAYIPTFTGNPYYTVRFPYGLPYLNGFNASIGYLRGLWVVGGSGSEWVEFRIGEITNQLRNYPVAVRIENADAAVTSLNDDEILRSDTLSRARQIQYMNDKINSSYSLHGLVEDIQFGTPSISCTALCMPDPTTLYCSVSTSFTVLDSQQYHSLALAIRGCPYRRIFILDSILNENMTTNLIYTTRATTDLEIIGFGNVQIVGTHEFVQDCLISDNMPTEIIWRDVTFKNPSNITTQPIIDFIPSSIDCVLPKMTFTSVLFLKGSLPTTWV